MSHLIFFTEGQGPDTSLDDVKAATPTRAVQLSNTTFGEIWDELFTKRKFVNPDDVVDTLELAYYTSIFDGEPVGVWPWELDAALDELTDATRDRHVEAVKDLYALADAATLKEAFVFIF